MDLPYARDLRRDSTDPYNGSQRPAEIGYFALSSHCAPVFVGGCFYALLSRISHRPMADTKNRRTRLRISSWGRTSCFGLPEEKPDVFFTCFLFRVVEKRSRARIPVTTASENVDDGRGAVSIRCKT